MILFVDDQRSPAFPAVIARSSAEAMALLDTQAWSEIWLDHDLGGPDTTMVIVTELERRAFEGRPLPVQRIVVHTANPVGGQRIMAALQRWYPVERRAADPPGRDRRPR